MTEIAHQSGIYESWSDMVHQSVIKDELRTLVDQMQPVASTIMSQSVVIESLAAFPTPVFAQLRAMLSSDVPAVAFVPTPFDLINAQVGQIFRSGFDLSPNAPIR